MLFDHNLGDTIFHRGRDEDIHRIGEVAQDIVGTAANKDTRALLGSLLDGIALKLEQALLRQTRLLIPIVEVRDSDIEQSTEKALLLVVLLENLLREATLLRRQIQQLAVVIFGLEIKGEHPSDVVAATA